MQRTAIGWVVVSSLGLAALAGCAVGADAEVDESELMSLPIEAGDENSVKLPPSSKPSDDDADDGASDGGTGDGGAGDGGTDAGNTDAGADAGGNTVSCASPNVCAAATDLGSVSGDEGSDVKTAQGSGSQWFKIKVTEDSSSLGGKELRAKAELTSPPGTNFDLFMYLAGGTSSLECSAVAKSSTTTGADSAGLEWGEGTVSNGSSDAANVTVEVRWVSGTCSPSAKWSLTVRGNAN